MDFDCLSGDAMLNPRGLTGRATVVTAQWCRRVESNHRPRAYESLALPLSYVGELVRARHNVPYRPIIVKRAAVVGASVDRRQC